MGHHFFPGRLIIGVMLICMSGIMYLYRNRRSPVVSHFTLKQYLWGCIVVLGCGIFVAVMAWGPE
jgi:hypothetical protein